MSCLKFILSHNFGEETLNIILTLRFESFLFENVSSRNMKACWLLITCYYDTYLTSDSDAALSFSDKKKFRVEMKSCLPENGNRREKKLSIKSSSIIKQKWLWFKWLLPSERHLKRFSYSWRALDITQEKQWNDNYNFFFKLPLLCRERAEVKKENFTCN